MTANEVVTKCNHLNEVNEVVPEWHHIKFNGKGQRNTANEVMPKWHNLKFNGLLFVYFSTSLPVEEWYKILY
jgi:hypothetical protein